MNFEELGVDFLLRLFLVNQNIHGGIKLAKAHVKFGLLKSSQGGSKLINLFWLTTTVTQRGNELMFHHSSKGNPKRFFRHLRGLYSYFSNQVSFGNSQLQQLV